jgi:hypothetical protein
VGNAKRFSPKALPVIQLIVGISYNRRNTLRTSRSVGPVAVWRAQQSNSLVSNGKSRGQSQQRQMCAE